MPIRVQGVQNKLAVAHEKYYKTEIGYADYDDVNCVIQVFAYIYLKENDPGALFNRAAI